MELLSVKLELVGDNASASMRRCQSREGGVEKELSR
jgi:hypothetical protein